MKYKDIISKLDSICLKRNSRAEAMYYMAEIDCLVYHGDALDVNIFDKMVIELNSLNTLNFDFLYEGQKRKIVILNDFFTKTSDHLTSFSKELENYSLETGCIEAPFWISEMPLQFDNNIELNKSSIKFIEGLYNLKFRYENDNKQLMKAKVLKIDDTNNYSCIIVVNKELFEEKSINKALSLKNKNI